MATKLQATPIPWEVEWSWYAEFDTSYEDAVEDDMEYSWCDHSAHVDCAFNHAYLVNHQQHVVEYIYRDIPF